MSVGVGIIDDQHREFIGLVNELTESVTSPRANFVVGLTLEKIFSFAQYHFLTEEKYFALFDYELADEHIKEHRKLLSQVEDYRHRFFDLHEDVAADLAKFLEVWVGEHLHDQDRKYIRCFNEHGLR